MTIEDFATLKEWIESELEDFKETWSDIIYHNLTEDELSNPWTDDVQRIYIWTERNVYHQSDDGGTQEYFLWGIPRNPPQTS
jgi:hypothetical protein